jgi:hypothetical protein
MITQDDLNRFKRANDGQRHRSNTFQRPTPTRVVRAPVRQLARPNIIVLNTQTKPALLDPADNAQMQSESLTTKTKSKAKHRNLKISVSLLIILVLIAVGGFVYYSEKPAKKTMTINPIPSYYRSSVDFPVYYPLPSKLPNGYTLASRSYTLPAKNVLVYAINYANGQHIDVSLQNKPSVTALSEFVRVHIPLHTVDNTSIGQATIGVLNNQTVASLPTNTGTWIITSAPININQLQLERVLGSFSDQ